MRRIAAIALLTGSLLIGTGSLARAAKKQLMGQAEDGSASISATVLDAEHIREAVGSDFENNYTVLDVHLTPRGDKPLPVRLDDFILRSEANGEHTGPLVAGQIAGAGAMVMKRTYADRSGPDQPRLLESTKVEMKNDAAGNPALDALKKTILAEKTTAEPVSGLLFFPLEKSKAKSLVLSYTSPQGKLRVSFK